jgi:hypothetical protein
MRKLTKRWKFWKRAGKREVTEPLPPEPNPAPEWPTSMSAKEILGLQQLIGNQAVLQMLGKVSNSTQVKQMESN